MIFFCFRQKFPLQVNRLWDGQNSLFMGCNSFAVKIAYLYAQTAEVFGNILCIFPSKRTDPSPLNGFRVGSHFFRLLSSQQRNAIFWPMQRINAKSNKSQSLSNEESLTQHLWAQIEADFFLHLPSGTKVCPRAFFDMKNPEIKVISVLQRPAFCRRS